MNLLIKIQYLMLTDLLTIKLGNSVNNPETRDELKESSDNSIYSY